MTYTEKYAITEYHYFTKRRKRFMIRFILVILTAFLYLILSIPVLLVLLLIRKKKPEVCDKVSRSLILSLIHI